jgi:hypothetical protein
MVPLLAARDDWEAKKDRTANRDRSYMAYMAS